MAGYKCVNFVDLCRLCASSSGSKTAIFSDEGKRKSILSKIHECLRLKIHEKDRLPKTVCVKCLKQLDAQVEFRDSVEKAQKMLESCLNSSKLKNGGMVYIKDESIKDTGSVASSTTVENTVPPTITLPTIQMQPLPTQAPQLKLVSAASGIVQQPNASIAAASSSAPIIINSLPKTFTQTQSSTSTSGSTMPTATIMAQNSDFLGSIIQAVGIQSNEQQIEQAQSHVVQQSPSQSQQQQHQQPMAQYTITLDGQTFKANQIHYKIQDTNQTFVSAGINNEAEQQTSYPQMDEFLKLKTPVKSYKKEANITPETTPAKKSKISVLIKSPQSSQPALVTTSPQKTAIIHSSTPVAVSSQPITITPVSSSANIGSFTTAPTVSMVSNNSISNNTTGSPIKTATIPVLDPKLMQGNKCIVPIMIKSESGAEQIALAPIANVGDLNKGMFPSVQYVQMKVQTGPDGMLRIGPAQMPPALSLTPQGLQQFGIQSLPTVQNQQPQPPQIQIQPQHSQLQTQIAMPSVQVPLSNYLSLVEKSSQVQAINEAQSSQASLVVTTQSAQQQATAQQPQHHVQPPQQLHIIQRQSAPTLLTQQQTTTQSSPQKPQKSNPPPQSQSIQPSTATIHRRDSDQNEDNLNSSSDSGGGSLSAQSLAATQQMKAISALSVKQESSTADQGSATSSAGTAGVSFTSCDVCSKSFKRKEHLMQHLKSHVGLRPFKCEESGCNKSFSRKEHLMRHIVSHTGKKMFSCPVCRKYFSRKDNLNKHKKTHQENSSSAPFQCSICSKGFYIKGQFLKHKQMHESVSTDALSQKIIKKSPTKENKDSVVTQNQSQSQQPQQQQQQQQQQPQQQQQQQQPQTQQQQQHQVQQVQLVAHQQSHQIQPQQLHSSTLQQQQQIFTIPAHIQSNGKSQIIHQLQIAMPASSVAQQTHHSGTMQTVAGASLAGLGGAGKTAIIKSADGNTATVYTIPPNFIIDGTQFLSASRDQLMSNVKIEQIT